MTKTNKFFNNGRVISYFMEATNIKMLFADQNESKFELGFKNVTRLSEMGCVGHYLSEVSQEGQDMNFYCDEKLVLSITSDDVEVLKLN